MIKTNDRTNYEIGDIVEFNSLSSGRYRKLHFIAKVHSIDYVNIDLIIVRVLKWDSSWTWKGTFRVYRYNECISRFHGNLKVLKTLFGDINE